MYRIYRRLFINIPRISHRIISYVGSKLKKNFLRAEADESSSQAEDSCTDTVTKYRIYRGPSEYADTPAMHLAPLF